MALAAELNVGGGVAAACSTHKGKFNRGGKDWAAIIAKDLQDHPGRSLVVAGEGQPPLVHALAHAINDALGNVGEGKPLTYVATTGAVAGGQLDSIRDLAARMEAGSVNTLVSLGSRSRLCRRSRKGRDEDPSWLVGRRDCTGLRLAFESGS